MTLKEYKNEIKTLDETTKKTEAQEMIGKTAWALENIAQTLFDFYHPDGEDDDLYYPDVEFLNMRSDKFYEMLDKPHLNKNGKPFFDAMMELFAEMYVAKCALEF